MSTKRSYMTD